MTFADDIISGMMGTKPMVLQRIDRAPAIQKVYAIRQDQLDALVDEIMTLREGIPNPPPED